MIVVSTKALRWDKSNLIFSAYASDLGGLVNPQISSEFYLESHKTNTRVKFVFVSTYKDDGGDVQGWRYISVDPASPGGYFDGRFRAGRFRALIIND